MRNVKSISFLVLLGTICAVQGADLVPAAAEKAVVDSDVPGNILNFGAVPDLTDAVSEHQNQLALISALNAANNGTLGDDRRVLVPSHTIFSIMPTIRVDDLNDVVVQIDGRILLSKNVHDYPKYDYDEQFIKHKNCANVTYRGEGEIDGQGWMWWLKFAFNKDSNYRPRLIEVHEMDGFEWSGIKLKNSPNSHLQILDSRNAYLHDFEIRVDPWKHILGYKIPMFGFNTDGIDAGVDNLLIERVNITSHDDAVVIKKGQNDFKYAQCAQNIVVRDLNVHLSTGLAIGSVTPSEKYSCVRNVTFENVELHQPFKGIYVKSNPYKGGNLTVPGSGGIIADIHYKNIKIREPIWWGIYIGPQQMKNPDGAGPGCMLYPLTPCDTEPLLSMTNITLTNVAQYNTLLIPGIIRCDATNPCTGFDWTNVTSTGWWKFPFSPLGYISENIEGKEIDVSPKPGFNSSTNSRDLVMKDVRKVIFHHIAEKFFEFTADIIPHKFAYLF